MAKLTDTLHNEPVKLLFAGVSGTGKTGALSSLAKAGYNIRILDFDNGTAILGDTDICPTEAQARIDVVKCTEKLKFVNGIAMPDGPAKAWANAMKALDNWPELGKPKDWGTKDILVIDSLTFAGKAALNYVMSMCGKAGQQPSQPNWGEAIRLMEGMLQVLYSDHMKCHVIVNTHIKNITTTNEKNEEMILSQLPSALGNKLPQEVGRYFNSILLGKVKPGNRRVIATVSDVLMQAKNIKPMKVPKELPLETGLADFFKLVCKQ